MREDEQGKFGSKHFMTWEGSRNIHGQSSFYAAAGKGWDVVLKEWREAKTVPALPIFLAGGKIMGK